MRVFDSIGFGFFILSIISVVLWSPIQYSIPHNLDIMDSMPESKPQIWDDRNMPYKGQLEPNLDIRYDTDTESEYSYTNSESEDSYTNTELEDSYTNIESEDPYTNIESEDSYTNSITQNYDPSANMLKQHTYETKNEGPNSFDDIDMDYIDLKDTTSHQGKKVYK